MDNIPNITVVLKIWSMPTIKLQPMQLLPEIAKGED